MLKRVILENFRDIFSVSSSDVYRMKFNLLDHLVEDDRRFTDI